MKDRTQGSYGAMNIPTRWHDPERGHYTIPAGTKVRRVLMRGKHEWAQFWRRQDRGEYVCMVRLQGLRRMIQQGEATWEN